MSEALPAGYQVERTGIQDPSHSQYFVLNVADDWMAREALAYLGNKYRQNGKQQLSKECFDALDQALPAFREVMESRQPKKK